MRTPLLLSSLLALGVLPPLPKPRTQEDLDREDAARRERVRTDLVARGIDPEEVRAAEAEEAEALKVRSEAYKAAMAAGKFRPEATAAANAAEAMYLRAMYLRAGRNHAGKTSGGVDWISEQAQALMSGGVLPDSIVMPSGTGPRITKADRNRQAQREARKVRKAAKARRGW